MVIKSEFLSFDFGVCLGIIQRLVLVKRRVNFLKRGLVILKRRFNFLKRAIIFLILYLIHARVGDGVCFAEFIAGLIVKTIAVFKF